MRIPTTAVALALVAACSCAHEPPHSNRGLAAVDSAVPSERAAPSPGEPRPGVVGATPPAADPQSKPQPQLRPRAQPQPSATSQREWTAGIVQVERQHGVQTQVGILAGKHAGYERVVFEFADSVPGYHLEYIDKPVRDCGAGHVRPVAGEGWLEVRLEPARAHDDSGHPTIAEREFKPRLDLVLELERTCDFEAVVTWVIGLASPNRFRVLELSDPPRLVVDIRTQ